MVFDGKTDNMLKQINNESKELETLRKDHKETFEINNIVFELISRLETAKVGIHESDYMSIKTSKT